MTDILRVPEFLTPAVCLRARDQYARWLAKGEAAPRGTLTTDVSFRLVNAAATAAVGKLVATKLREHFGTCPLKLDYAAYTRILPGGSHELHADGFKLDGMPNHTASRVVTGIVYLTAEGVDHDGGTIRFPKVLIPQTRPNMRMIAPGVGMDDLVHRPPMPLEIAPIPGLLVGFLSTLEHQHEVTTVTRGGRDALVFWYQKDCGCGCK